MNKANLAALKASVNIEDIIGNYVELERKGSEYKGICPFHNDTDASLNVNPTKQVWMCPVCVGAGDKGKKGDVYDFLIARGNSLPQSILILTGDAESETPIKSDFNKPARKKKIEWKHVRPVVEATDFTHYENGKPTVIHTYRDAKGVIGYVCRFDLENGKKETLPFCYTQSPDGSMYRWSYQGFTNRPLYNADLIAAHPGLPVVLVEGEKVADWMQSRSNGKYVATTWVGGSNQVEKTSFEQLDGRRVLFCRDNDIPGEKCMTYAFDSIQSDCKKWGEIPEGSPKGWDMADSNLTPQQTQDFVRRGMREPAPKRHSEDEQYFTYLGFEKSDNQPTYIFYGKQSKTIFRLSAASMTKPSLMALAPPLWWETYLGSFKNTEAATNLLISTSYKVGIYSPKNVRGRGAWYDDGRVVIHAGDKLIVDGKECALGELDTTYIYEIGESFNFNTKNPLSAKEATKTLTITKKLNWERGVNAYLLAGWCVIAPVCGALKWRPHIWLTGPAGSGKSWVFTYVLRKLLGETVLDVQGSTTEAGIRQTLGFDAMPVAFDEIDGNDAKAQARIQENIELARSASADDTGKIIKGSAGHTAKSYLIRSCFAFSSISIGIDKGSDRRRTTTLSLVTADSVEPDEQKRTENWSNLQQLHLEVMTDDYIVGLHARTIKLLPIILENCRTFNAALVKVLMSQPMADQISPMLAGAYSLSSDHLISFEDAVKFIEAQDWNEEKEGEKVKDEIELFHFLMQWMIRVDGWGDRTAGELIAIAGGFGPKSIMTTDETVIPASIAIARLKRSGIRADSDYIHISSVSSEIKHKLKDTRWSKNYKDILKRLPDSEDTTQRFTGPTERCTRLPIKLLQ
jgi:putative DNA primase/helicase